ncbi:hypothetical protein EDB19DRAFT_1916975 [Suillus lakei]|nr:hypothetical protein EDB19DRAFT_1916975 [Suillus lakei]
MEQRSLPVDIPTSGNSTQPPGQKSLFLTEMTSSTLHYLPMRASSQAHSLYSARQRKLWNLETNEPIGTPLHHEEWVNTVTFSADGKFLVTSCEGYDDNNNDNNNDIYIWDLSAIVKDAGLLSDIADVTPRPAPKMKAPRRMPPGFLMMHSEMLMPNNSPTPAPRQRTLGRISSFWHRSKPHGATERDTQPRWTQNLVSGMMRRRHGSDVELREPPVVDVPCTAGQPKEANYQIVSTFQDAAYHPAAQRSSTEHTILVTANTPHCHCIDTIRSCWGLWETSRPRITIDSGWRTRFMLWRRTPNYRISHGNDIATLYHRIIDAGLISSSGSAEDNVQDGDDDDGDDDDDDDDDDEWELQHNGLYIGSYSRVLLLNAFVQLFAAVIFTVLVLLPDLAWPIADFPSPYPASFPFPLPETLISSAFFSLAHLLRVPFFSLASLLLSSESACLVSTFLHVSITNGLRLAALAILQVRHTMDYPIPYLGTSSSLYTATSWSQKAETDSDIDF